MTAPTLFAPLWLSVGIVLIETIAREGCEREARYALRTARKGARRLSHRRQILLMTFEGLRSARFHPLEIRGALGGVYETISNAPHAA